MTTSTPAPLNSAVDRPVRLKARPDLIALPMRFRGERYWHLKDPVSLRHFQLREEEYFVWGLLDGQRSLRQISELCADRFAPKKLEPAHLQDYLALLHREGLLLSESPGQGDVLLERGRRQHREAWRRQWTNPLAIRFRGINPDRYLTWLHARLHWLFKPGLAILLAAAVFGAIVQLALHWSEFARQLPRADDFFVGDNLLWFALALIIVKVVHELAHGLACKHYGAECTELGVMLLVFTPCLYCNVTDAWMLPNKWQRMFIGAAGILAELALASGAVFLWRYTEAGFLNALAVRVVLVCSAGTVLFNGNPLLRFDGYYVLADWLEIPNLHARANASLRRVVGRVLFGTENAAGSIRKDPFSYRLALFGLASLAYRLTLIVLVAWTLYTALARAGLPMLAGLLLAAAVMMMLAKPSGAILRWLGNPARPPLGQWPGRWRCLAIVFGIVVLGCVPWPCTVPAPAVLRPRDAVAVYTQAGGELISAVDEGTVVSQGTTLATLRDVSLERKVHELAGQATAQRQRVRNLRRQQLSDSVAAGELPAAEEALRALESQLAEQQARQKLLTTKAPVTGMVIPPPRRPSTFARRELSAWTGTPFEPRNRGAYHEAGTLLCHLGDARETEAILAIDQGQIELVHVGQSVRVRLAGGPALVLTGEIVEISEMASDAAPEELVVARALPVRRDADGVARLASPTYQAVARLDAAGSATWPGLVGRARIYVAPRSVFGRLLRFVTQTFHAPL